jgi:hypothetical protein
MTDTTSLYWSVLEKVVARLRPIFTENGMGEDALADLERVRTHT